MKEEVELDELGEDEFWWQIWVCLCKWIIACCELIFFFLNLFSVNHCKILAFYNIVEESRIKDFLQVGPRIWKVGSDPESLKATAVVWVKKHEPNYGYGNKSRSFLSGFQQVLGDK